MADITPAPGVRLHVVTGKGGTGKTTVAAALALALASDGGRVLLAEVEGRQGISRALDVAPLGHVDARIVQVAGGGEVWGLSVEPEDALTEYLDKHRLGRAVPILRRLGATEFATSIAPGVRDVLLIGKVYEAARRRDPRTSAPVYDAVVLDAPPTGRITRFLQANAEVSDLARTGPIHDQAGTITRFLRSPACVVHLTTLLEEMPVQETLEAVEDLRAIDMRLGSVVVDRVEDDLLSTDGLRALHRWTGPDEDRADLRRTLTGAGLDLTADTLDTLVTQARVHADRLAAEDRLLGRLEGLPVVVLPELPDGVGPDGIHTLAGHLATGPIPAESTP